MSWWKSLRLVERWSESHPTHVRIFGAAMKYLTSLGPAAKLRLYHEVTVARAADQFFEYRNCHGRTGMLNAVVEQRPRERLTQGPAGRRRPEAWVCRLRSRRSRPHRAAHFTPAIFADAAGNREAAL